MVDVEQLYKLYEAGDETLYDELEKLSSDDIEYIYHDCDINLLKYYEFRQFIENYEYEKYIVNEQENI